MFICIRGLTSNGCQRVRRWCGGKELWTTNRYLYCAARRNRERGVVYICVCVVVRKNKRKSKRGVGGLTCENQGMHQPVCARNTPCDRDGHKHSATAYNAHTEAVETGVLYTAVDKKKKRFTGAYIKYICLQAPRPDQWFAGDGRSVPPPPCTGRHTVGFRRIPATARNSRPRRTGPFDNRDSSGRYSVEVYQANSTPAAFRSRHTQRTQPTIILSLSIYIYKLLL